MPMMRALVKKFPKKGLWLEKQPIPDPRADEVRIRVQKMAICGTDLHIYEWDDWAQKTLKLPLIVGHEFMGVIDALGDGVKGLSLGDRVSGEGHLTCSVCRNCRAGKRHLCRNTVGIGVHQGGAFAEFIVMPVENVFRVPNSIKDEVAAIFDPLGNAVHTALSFDLVGEDILITGAGPIGCMAAQICRHVGARHVVISDINPYRLELAKKMGATYLLNPQKETTSQVMKHLDMHEGFDVGLEMSGHPGALVDMLAAMNHGGKIALLGIFPQQPAVNWNDIIFKGLRLKGIYGREMFETWYKMTSLLQSGLQIDTVITHQIAAEDFERGFELLASGQAGKIVMHWR